jgi:phenylalanine-4-hydroxylase
MSETLEKLPDFLRPYCSTQDMTRYTARDHAAWRCIMRRALPFFREHAVKGYEEGLKRTALPIDRIPDINEVDKALNKIGWGAVPVRGFIAPWAFLEFQARRILPIATDMRTIDHITYTPAPDIVHEAAGHAPILPDEGYSAYLARYAQLCTKAIFSKQDARLYEAVRVLSDIKEKPESTPAEIAAAERKLEERMTQMTFVSEAARVGRMSWWTAEYGLVGDVKNPKIFGAGLLSSVGEAKNCLTDAVKKIPLSIECTNVGFNITKPQPQLFVAKTMQHLVDVLEELDASLSYRIGGLYALGKAKESEDTTTTVLDSGIAIGGVLTEYTVDGKQPIFLKWSGPVQLAYNGRQLTGQGTQRHSEGFSTPIGRWESWSRDPSRASESDLASLGLIKGRKSHLRFRSGFEVSGVISHFEFKDGKLLFITWEDCTVKRGDKVTFEPSWGSFDMAVGTEVPSVAGGPADRTHWSAYTDEQVETNPARVSPYTPTELKLFEIYGSMRKLRESGEQNIPLLKNLSETLMQNYSSEWLALTEAYEIARNLYHIDANEHHWVAKLKNVLDRPSLVQDKDTHALFKHSMSLIH